MIVAFQPGGTINDVRIVLKFKEKLPRKYNHERAEVYTETENNASQWVLVKPLLEVLTPDSPLLAGAFELAPTDILDLTIPAETATFDHVDIIRLGDSLEDNEDKA
jgi:hypothetical protein